METALPTKNNWEKILKQLLKEQEMKKKQCIICKKNRGKILTDDGSICYKCDKKNGR